MIEIIEQSFKDFSLPQLGAPLHHPNWRSLFLSCFLGVTAGSGLLPLFSALVSVQAAEVSSQGPQEGVIKTCTGQRIALGAPQLTEADLKGLTRCSSEVMPQLLEALKSQDWKVKVIAAHTLGLLGTKAKTAIPALSGLIRDENSDIRFAAAQALGEIGTEAIVPALTQALQDKDENVRVSAAVAFQQIGSLAQQAKPVLITALWDGNWFVRSSISTTIAKLGLSTSDIPDLVKPLRDNPEPNNGAIVALMLSIYPPVFNKLEDLPLFFIKGLESEDPQVRESSAIGLEQVSLTRPGFFRLHESMHALQKVVEDQDSKVRLRALKALDQIARGPATEYYGQKEDTQLINNIESVLLKGLHDPDPGVRQIALESFESEYKYPYSDTKRTTVILAALEATQDENFTVRQSAFDLLNSNLDKLDSLPSLLKPQLLKKVLLALTRSLYDKNTSVRQNAGNSLDEKLLLPVLSEILQQKNIDPEIRYDAIAIIAMGGRHGGSIHFEQSQTIIELLKKALKDPDIGTRVNAAHALERIEEINSKDAVSVFIEGLKSDNPSAKLHAIFALNQMCDSISRCAEAKRALPLVIDVLKVNVKPLQYAAALAISYIDPKEESGVNILGEILSEETDSILRDNAVRALNHQKLDSPDTLSVIVQSLGFEDKQTRYARTCNQEPYIGLQYTAFLEEARLYSKALETTDVRLSASHSFHTFLFPNKPPSLSEIQFLVSKITSILKDHSSQSTEYHVLQNIFKLKGQDIRRSAVYSLGTIKTGLSGNNINYYYNLYNLGDRQKLNIYPQVQREIISTLKNLVTDQKENLDIRWMAAAELQVSNISIDDFFLEEKLINPATALAQSRWIGAVELKQISNQDVSYLFSLAQSYDGDTPRPRAKPVTVRLQSRYLLNQYGFLDGRGGIEGLDFDLYLKKYIYDNRLGCGSGLIEVYNTLQKLFNEQKK